MKRGLSIAALVIATFTSIGCAGNHYRSDRGRGYYGSPTANDRRAYEERTRRERRYERERRNGVYERGYYDRSGRWHPTL